MHALQDAIANACRMASVDPANLLCCLLEGLEYRHPTYRQTFGWDMGSDAGLFDEVSHLMDLAGPDERTPASLLRAVALHLRVRANLDPGNVPLQVVRDMVRGYLATADGCHDEGA